MHEFGPIRYFIYPSGLHDYMSPLYNKGIYEDIWFDVRTSVGSHIWQVKHEILDDLRNKIYEGI